MRIKKRLNMTVFHLFLFPAISNFILMPWKMFWVVTGKRDYVFQSSKQSKTKKRRSKRAEQFSLLLMTVTVSFLVLYFGSFLCGIATNIVLEDATSKKDFFIQLRQLSLMINNCINFLFYFSSGTKFREAFRCMIEACWTVAKKKIAKAVSCQCVREAGWFKLIT